jgi:hypothetical protein
MNAKIPQSASELEGHLNEHIGFLKSSADAYDRGEDDESKRLAVSLRVLFHDTATSHSLLGQLGRSSDELISTNMPHDQGNLSTHGGLVMIAASGKHTKYVAMLDDGPYKRWLPHTEWWNEIVFVDDRKQSLSRKELILAVANQDGGAHVDPALNETYARLSRHNSLGWVVSTPSQTQPIPKSERAAIRQIAHEVLKTLLSGYSKKPAHVADLIFGGGMIHTGSSVPPLPAPHKIGRNDLCPCGSQMKFKKCHGTTAV